MKPWHVAVYLVVLAACLLAGGAIFHSIDGRLHGVEEHMATELDQIKITAHGRTRVFTRRHGESTDEWLRRAQRDSVREELGGEYLCTTLEGCAPPVTSIEVCTWCPESPPSTECQKEHEDQVARACELFECDC